MRQVSDRGLQLIKTFEGLRLEVYTCSAGKLTVGYGHTKIAPALKEVGLKITKEQADTLFRFDVQEFAGVVDRVTKSINLNQNEFDALVSFTFNFGATKFLGSTLLAKLMAGDKLGAAGEFAKWVHSNGKKEPGLVKRRQAECDLFLSPRTHDQC